MLSCALQDGNRMRSEEMYLPLDGERPRERGGVVVHALLFVLTFITTAAANARFHGADLLAHPSDIQLGFPYAVTLMSILFAHELGHYAMARAHNVEATLPYFIPAPPFFFIGTFGAFIRMKSVPDNRRALFDIGAAGPWGGFLVAVPALFFGLGLSEVVPTPESELSGLMFREPLIMQAMSAYLLGVDPQQATVMLHPIALAAWVGFLVTALNLLPVGQLDGGHVSYAVLGERWHAWISRGAVVGLLVLGFGGWSGWLAWVVLLVAIGFRHPRTGDPSMPLNRLRVFFAVLTVVIFILVFMPEPIVYQPEPIMIPAGEMLEV